MVIAREAKYCVNCMGKDIKYSMKHGRECTIKTKKGAYSCKKDSCLLHMWLCSKHKAENKDSMEKFAMQLQARSGVTLVFQSSIMESRKTTETINQDVIPNSVSTAEVPPTSPLAHCTTSGKGIKQAVRKLQT